MGVLSSCGSLIASIVDTNRFLDLEPPRAPLALEERAPLARRRTIFLHRLTHPKLRGEEAAH